MDGETGESPEQVSHGGIRGPKHMSCVERQKEHSLFSLLKERHKGSRKAVEFWKKQQPPTSCWNLHIGPLEKLNREWWYTAAGHPDTLCDLHHGGFQVSVNLTLGLGITHPLLGGWARDPSTPFPNHLSISLYLAVCPRRKHSAGGEGLYHQGS